MKAISKGVHKGGGRRGEKKLVKEERSTGPWATGTRGKKKAHCAKDRFPDGGDAESSREREET